MKRYRVAIKNSRDCRIELTFNDLCVKYSNGFSPTLKIKEGDEVPLDVCDPEDVRKSWLVGSLKGYLENKWLEEILDDKISPEPVVKASISQFITEQMVMAPKIVPVVVVSIPEPAKVEVPSTPILPEVVKIAEPVAVSAPILESIHDLALIKSFDDFNRLSHALKLRFIKESNNIELLKDISGKTSSVQFKNNINLRLTQIKA